MSDTDTLFPIGYVSRITGLTTHVIRVWEKRYAVVAPHRSSGNRRLYSRDDIFRLSLLKNAVKAGQNISNAARMKNRELEALYSVSESHEPVERGDSIDQTFSDAKYHLEKCLSAVLSIQGQELDSYLRNAAVDLPKISLMSDVIATMFGTIGKLWADGSIKIIHEHMASTVTQGFLWDILRSSRPANSHPAMVVTTPAGQWCQIGALMAAVAASDAGWDTYYFGPNLPAEEIAAAVKQKQAVCVALSISFQGDKNLMERELKLLRKCLPPDVDIVVGGRASAAHGNLIRAIGARQFSNLRNFVASLSAYPLGDG